MNTSPAAIISLTLPLNPGKVLIRVVFSGRLAVFLSFVFFSQLEKAFRRDWLFTIGLFSQLRLPLNSGCFAFLYKRKEMVNYNANISIMISICMNLFYFFLLLYFQYIYSVSKFTRHIVFWVLFIIKSNVVWEDFTQQAAVMVHVNNSQMEKVSCP